MAVSKNKRKSNKKRAKQHCAPETMQAVKQAKEGPILSPEEKRKDRANWIAVIVMIVGFVVAQIGSGQVHSVLQLIFYPVSLAGAVFALLTLDKGRKGHTVSLICFVLYSILVILQYIALLQNFFG